MAKEPEPTFLVAWAHLIPAMVQGALQAALKGGQQPPALDSPGLRDPVDRAVGLLVQLAARALEDPAHEAARQEELTAAFQALRRIEEILGAFHLPPAQEQPGQPEEEVLDRLAEAHALLAGSSGRVLRAEAVADGGPDLGPPCGPALPGPTTRMLQLLAQETRLASRRGSGARAGSPASPKAVGTRAGESLRPLMGPTTAGQLLSLISKVGQLAPPALAAALQALQAFVSGSASLPGPLAAQRLSGLGTSIRSAAGLLSHPDRSVRLGAVAFARCLAPSSVLDECGSPAEGAVDPELQLLRDWKGLLQAQTGSPEVRDSVILAVAGFLLASERGGLLGDGKRGEKLETVALSILIGALGDPDPLLPARSCQLLHRVLRERGLEDSPLELIEGNRTLEDWTAGQMLAEGSELHLRLPPVLGTTEPRLLRALLHSIIPRIIAAKDSAKLELLSGRLLPEFPGMTASSLLVESAHYGYAEALITGHLVKPQGGRMDITEAADFVESVIKWELDVYIGNSQVVGRLLHEIVRMQTRNTSWGPPGSPLPPELVRSTKRIIQTVFQIRSSRPAEALGVSDELQAGGHLVQLLTKLAPEIRRSGGRQGRRQGSQQVLRAVRALQLLMALAGAHLANILPQAMALLTKTLQLDAAARMQGLAAWQQLVVALREDAPQELDRLASQIVVAVLPALEAPAPGGSEAAAGGRLQELGVAVINELITGGGGLTQ